MRRYLAIDIGASSGRHIVGWSQNGRILTEEVFRFPNGVKEENRHLVWDIETLLQNVKEGIDKALESYGDIASLSIDTWGVDYVLLNGNNEILPCYAYRDNRTKEAIQEVHFIIPFEELYSSTGIQYQPFNTIYQLYADLKVGRLQQATDFLMIPEYLMYRLCGSRVHEYTNATTTGLICPESGDYDKSIISRLGLPSRLFTTPKKPGTQIGQYKGMNIVLCATHDTGSAVEGIPMTENSPYISSGTWSLLGVKTPRPITDRSSMKANYSNEGGVGYNRYQKNLMGMWLVNNLKDELCPEKTFTEIVDMAQSSTFNETVDIDDPVFLSPKSMKAAFDSMLKAKGPTTKDLKDADYFRCAYRSLAQGYKKALDELENNTKEHYEKLYIVGGGAKNQYLNRLTAEATGKELVALPIEATALGNLKIQMEADK